MATQKLPALAIWFAATLAAAGGAQAQETSPPDPASRQPVEEDEQLVLRQVQVISGRARGSVIGDATPITEFDEEDIRSLGASNIDELIELLSPQVASGRGNGGRPIVLLNGTRIASFREIRAYPSEAIERVEVLPEEVALRYGYRADQRVINIILKESFRALTLEAEAGGPTAGAGGTGEVEASYLRIRDNRRWTLSAELEETGEILESDRDLVEQESSAEGFSQQPFRTLQPESRELNLTGALATPVGDTMQGSLSLGIDLTESRALLGQPAVDFTVPADSPFSISGSDEQLIRISDDFGPLSRESETRSAELALGLSRIGDRWTWNFTSTASLEQRDRETFRTLDESGLQAALDTGQPGADPQGDIAPFLAPVLQKSETETAGLDTQILLSGRAFELPAGDARTSVTLGYNLSDRSDRSETDGEETLTDLSRGASRLQVNLDVPLISDNQDLPFPGELDLNLNGRVEDISDFDLVTAQGWGLSWSPADSLKLTKSYLREDNAPSLAQLSEPVESVPNRAVFDFLTGDSVFVTVTDGGNPDLAAETRTVWGLGVQFEPFEDIDFDLRGDYTDTRTENPVASFPSPSLEVEEAFPERFVRDEGGTLLAFDSRPVNFERSERREWRWSLDYRHTFEKETPERRGEGRRPEGEQRSPREGVRGPGGGSGGEQGGRGGGGRGRDRDDQNRIGLSLVHTWRLEDRLVIAPGLPVIDYLGGSSAGSRGGQPEHEVQLRASGNLGRLGSRVEVNWQDDSFVDGGEDASRRLDFSSLTTVDARIFYSFRPERTGGDSSSFLSGARLSLRVDNLFDERLQVTDAYGLTPVNYQPDLLDPRGRTVSIQFRKLFQ